MALSRQATVDADASLAGNIQFTQSLLESLRTRIDTFIYASTVDVYDGCSELPLVESSRIEPATLYAASKYYCEKLVQVLLSNETSVVVARLTHLYGAGEPRSGKLLSTAIAAALEGRLPAVVGSPDARRDFLHVNDAAEAMIRLLSSDLPKRLVLNVASGSSRTVSQVLDLVASLVFGEGTRADRSRADSNAPRRDLDFDVERMRKLLGDWECREFYDGVAEQIEAAR